ncbi:hypothetical protein FXB39_17720 [Nocardioides sp. BGMRC 2183]|nr:hypothetical protein FXB39_17720 [Nocardioides sp. BGMRC 2183]
METEHDPWWDDLTAALASMGQVTDREPVGLVVATAQARAAMLEVEIVMTPEEWDDLVDIGWGVIEGAVEYVCNLVRERTPQERFLVYSQYQLVPHDAPAFPPNPDLIRIQELAARHPDGVIPGAGWYAFPPSDD